MGYIAGPLSRARTAFVTIVVRTAATADIEDLQSEHSARDGALHFAARQMLLAGKHIVTPDFCLSSDVLAVNTSFSFSYLCRDQERFVYAHTAQVTVIDRLVFDL